MHFNWPHYRAQIRTSLPIKAQVLPKPPTLLAEQFSAEDLQAFKRITDQMATIQTSPAPAAATPTAPALSPAQQIFAEVITLGLTAAAMFIKNPATQQHAADITAAISPLLALLEGLI